MYEHADNSTARYHVILHNLVNWSRRTSSAVPLGYLAGPENAVAIGEFAEGGRAGPSQFSRIRNLSFGQNLMRFKSIRKQVFLSGSTE